jgi:acyl carrier protein
LIGVYQRSSAAHSSSAILGFPQYQLRSVSGAFRTIPSDHFCVAPSRRLEFVSLSVKYGILVEFEQNGRRARLCVFRPCGRAKSKGMDQASLYEQLTAIFRDVLDDDSLQLTPELTAKDVDGWDSLTHLRLLLSVEKAFRVRFTTAEIGKLENVGDLASLIQSRTQPA